MLWNLRKNNGKKLELKDNLRKKLSNNILTISFTFITFFDLELFIISNKLS